MRRSLFQFTAPALLALAAFGQANASPTAPRAKPAPDAATFAGSGQAAPAERKPVQKAKPDPAPTKRAADAPMQGEMAKPAPAPGHRSKDPKDAVGRARMVATQMRNIEQIYRQRTARIDRLNAVYQQKGEGEKMRELDELRLEAKRQYDLAMNGYRNELGPELYGKLSDMLAKSSAPALKPRGSGRTDPATLPKPEVEKPASRPAGETPATPETPTPQREPKPQ
jgi:hypothetical protein